MDESTSEIDFHLNLCVFFADIPFLFSLHILAKFDKTKQSLLLPSVSGPLLCKIFCMKAILLLPSENVLEHYYFSFEFYSLKKKS